MAIECVKTELRDYLRCVIEEEGLPEDAKISIKGGSEVGEGFVGINSAIEIETEGKILYLFAKAGTKNAILRNQICMETLFIKEIYFYENIYPEFLKFQLKRNVRRPFKNVPRCYLSSKEYLKEILIFENLKEQGYALYNKKIDMNDEHIFFVFKLYAQFHAVSYAMKDQNHELYSKLTGDLKNLVWDAFKTAGIDVAISRYCEEAKDLFSDPYILKRIENLNDVLTDIVSKTDEFADEFSVISHGDCWFNNFLFKYKDADDQNILEDVMILDWQMVKVGSPVLDLSYFFYGVATKRSMSQLELYMKFYHDTLSENIRQMGSDPESLYSYSVFKEHWNKVSKYGLFFSFPTLRVMLMDKSEVLDSTEAMNSGKTFGDTLTGNIGNNEVYKQRVKDVIEHFVYNGFI